MVCTLSMKFTFPHLFVGKFAGEFCVQMYLGAFVIMGSMRLISALHAHL